MLNYVLKYFKIEELQPKSSNAAPNVKSAIYI